MTQTQLFLAMSLLAMLTACGEVPRPGRLVMIWYDASASVRRHDVMEDALRRTVRDVGPGDRVVVGLISSRTADDLTIALDTTPVAGDPATVLASVSGIGTGRWETERLARADSLAEHVVSVVRAARNRVDNRATRIVEAFEVSGALARSDGRPARILVLSDGVEESDRFRLTSKGRVDGTIGKQIAERHGAPILEGIKVTMVGVGSPSVSGLSSFWNAWLRHAGAVVDRAGVAGQLLTDPLECDPCRQP
jgi:hypothetical protein